MRQHTIGVTSCMHQRGHAHGVPIHWTTTDFDIYAALDDVLAETRGISRAEAGGSVHFTGADPIVPSAMSSAGLLCLPL